MNFSILTIFPEMYDVLKIGLIGDAIEKHLFDVNVYNIRDFSKDKHKHTDDYPYGGGAGMIMTPQPVFDCLNYADPDRKFKRICMSPRGRKLDQQLVTELSKFDNILILNGSYEGIDQRIIDNYIDMEVSIGDYVLTSGDLASMVLINCISRYIPGVLGSDLSLNEESFSDNLLEYPQYTRPQNFNGFEVPSVLLSGNHQDIENWRRLQRIEITHKLRPDLIKKD